MAVKVRETGYGKWKIPVIIIAVILVIICVITGILLKDSTGVDLSEESVRIEVASGDGVDVVTSKLS